jgi:hypothetical protein
MTPSFSQRKGLKPIRTALQIDSMDDGLRSRLWDAVTVSHLSSPQTDYFTPMGHTVLEVMTRAIWHRYFKRPIDSIDAYWVKNLRIIRNYFFECDWQEVYDFLEFLSSEDSSPPHDRDFRRNCNSILTHEMSGYRFVGNTIAQVTSEEEVVAIEDATHLTGKLQVVRQHIEQALTLLSDRKNPDYRNSIKEAISAVEAVCQIVGGNPKATLGDAIKKLDGKISIHLALRQAFEKLYGYTSDAGGIRHALTEETHIGFADAKYMLVSCSAFVNYIVAKAAESGIVI